MQNGNRFEFTLYTLRFSGHSRSAPRSQKVDTAPLNRQATWASALPKN